MAAGRSRPKGGHREASAWLAGGASATRLIIPAGSETREEISWRTRPSARLDTSPGHKANRRGRGSPAPIYAQRTILLMRNRSKLLLAALAATAVFGALVATASATRIAMSEQHFRATWTNLEFQAVGGIFTIKCPVTIEGSFHSSTISKVLEALVGYVTQAAVGAPAACTGGTVTILTANLPWHIRYNGFSGTLPEITRIHLRLILAEFLINRNDLALGRFSCLYRSTPTNPMRAWVEVNATTHVVESMRPDRTAQIKLFARLAESTATCPAEGNLGENATSTLTVPSPGTAKITVTLVA